MKMSSVRLRLNEIFLRFSNPQKIFENIYKNRSWGNSPSISGTGSDLSQTKVISLMIPELIKKYHVSTMLDAPCGDFYWLKSVNLPNVKYIGLDIVSSIILNNNRSYSNKERRFIVGNIIADTIPKVDLILCRDCLVHFSFHDIEKTVTNIKKSGATFLLTTSFPEHNNADIHTGQWRPINLQSEPFNFPPPIEIINEKCTEGDGKYGDKCIALWRISDLPDNTAI